jgi:hypothetical protein
MRPVIERAHVAEPGEAPGRVVAGDECGDRRPDLGGGVEDATTGSSAAKRLSSVET